MQSRLYIYCPACGKRSQTIHEGGEPLDVKCGDCLMDRCEVVEMIAERVRPISAEP